MKTLIITFWCLIPVGLLAYHYGPGREQMTLDASASLLDIAKSKATAGDWSAAVTAYEETLATLPKDRVSEASQIRLELAKARMETAQLPKARAELATLADELSEDPKADSKLRDETLATLASSRFYMTYLMKLEGLPAAEWEPEIEAARQEQKLLSERATEAGNTVLAQKHAEDLESTIRLARMDPSQLYGKAIPKQCSSCKSGKCAGTKPSQKPSQKSKDSRSAGSGAPMDGQGS